MFRKTIFVTVFLGSGFLSSGAMAEPVKLTGAEIAEVLADVILYAGDKAEIEQIFQKSGQTVYIDRGSMSQGSWFVEGDQYCSRWPPGVSKSCFDVTRDGETITFIASSGKTYPMRKKK
jgi:hypothetical protein